MDNAIAAIVADDGAALTQWLAVHPATGTVTDERFIEAITHQIYRGDTLLHIAAAAFRTEMVTDLLARGADVMARNRRGATPLHYAADANRYAPEAQASAITALLAAGADVNVRDKDGTAPLHRAVRKRGFAAVKVLIAGGADVHLLSGKGSTPMKLALVASGQGGSGSPAAKAEQAEIITLLQTAGA